ncbi:MAG: CBS domain-containing protein [Planctomycetota bacterium]
MWRGGFLAPAGRASMTAGQLLEHLGWPRAITVYADDYVPKAIQKMRHHRIGCVMVTDHFGKLEGVLSERDLLFRGVTASRLRASEQVRRIMSRANVICGLDTSLEEVGALMGRHDVRHLPVTRDRRLVGVLSMRDMLRYHVAAARSA